MLKELIAVLQESPNIKSDAQQTLIFAIVKYLKSNKRGVTPILLEHFEKSTESTGFRMFLGDLLSDMNPDAAKSTFRKVLMDSNQAIAIRARCAYYLGFAHDQEIPNTLATLISDTNHPTEIQKNAITGLTVYYQHSPYFPDAHHGVLVALSRAVGSPNELISICATRTLGYLRTRDALIPLRNSLNSRNKDTRRQAILAYAKMGITDNTVTQKSFELHSEDSYNQAPLIETFGRLKIREAIPILRRYLTERTDEYGMCLAAAALAEIGNLDDETKAAMRTAAETAKDSFGKKEIERAYRRVQRQ